MKSKIKSLSADDLHMFSQISLQFRFTQLKERFESCTSEVKNQGHFTGLHIVIL